MTRTFSMLKGVVVAAAVVLVALIVGWPAGATSSGDGTTATAKSGFCAPRMAKDFLQPLDRMVAIHRVPSSGKLPFGPKGLILETRGGRLVVGGGWTGFGFSDEAVGQIRRLNWDVSAQLLQVNSKGVTVAELSSKKRRIKSINGDRINDFLFRVATRPAFYRVDINFHRSGTHQALRSFSNYVRVVRPWFDARLLMSRPVVHREEVISARLANFGTEALSSISPDWRFAVQRFDGRDWVPASGSPPPRKHKAIVQRLAPGKMDECVDFRVPADEEPGDYRFVMVVERSSERTTDRAVQLMASFKVSGRSLK